MTVTCPHPDCGREMWEYDPHLYTCKAGHKMAKDHVLPGTPRREPATHVVIQRPALWQDYRIGYALAVVLAVAQILEVVL